MTSSLPDTMRVLSLNAYEGASALELITKPLPKPSGNQLLVKMHAAPINPSDLLFLEGNYGQRKPLPVAPGFEGSGTVVAAGSPLLERLYVGRKVACGGTGAGDGTWAEYLLTSPFGCVPLRNASLEQGATMLVNPLTVYLMLRQAKREGHKAIIHTAAASSLGKMLIKRAQELNLPLINIVRRDAQVTMLRELGADYVLNSNDADFAGQLQTLSRDLDATLALDAVAGEMTSRLLDAMPNGSTVRVYGALSMQEGSINPRWFVFENKRLEGFWLADVARERFWQDMLPAFVTLPNLVGKQLQTMVQARFDIVNYQQALSDYQANMSDGKVLLTFDQETKYQEAKDLADEPS
jgi:NADPH:quinone reductase-like Zn-dependent oxidoreductase